MNKTPVPLAASHAVRRAHTLMTGRRQHSRPIPARLARAREVWPNPSSASVRQCPDA